MRNTGDIAIDNASVSASLSDNASFVSGTQGILKGFGNATSWNVGTLGAGESKTFDVVANTRGAGNAALSAVVRGNCLEEVTARDNVKITGIPALLLEVVDLVDPIEVGGQQTYVITVTNQGTAPATNVKISGSLEDMSLINSTGSSNVSESYGKLTFGVIPSIQPKSQVSWNVVVKANSAGDKRFSVSMNSDETIRSVDETESTYVY